MKFISKSRIFLPILFITKLYIRRNCVNSTHVINRSWVVLVCQVLLKLWTLLQFPQLRSSQLILPPLILPYWHLLTIWFLYRSLCLLSQCLTYLVFTITHDHQTQAQYNYEYRVKCEKLWLLYAESHLNHGLVYCLKHYFLLIYFYYQKKLEILAHLLNFNNPSYKTFKILF